MNTSSINQLFSQYINRFSFINNPEHQEYYKWQVCYDFHRLMDEALTADITSFTEKLKIVRNRTYNIIDNYTQPFAGLVKISEKHPEEVQQMFLDLYAPVDNIELLMKKISNFFNKSNELLNEDFKDSYLYKQNSHSVSSYLFLYDPDNYYMYKASECTTMADCIGFYDDWGTGDNIKLDVFYRMCDEILEEINKNDELLATDASRYSSELNFGNLHKDKNKHILLFDIIYCSQSYNFFDTVSFDRPTSKEKKLITEYRNKAAQLKKEYDLAKQQYVILSEALEYFANVVKTGDIVTHKKFKQGTIKQINEQYITVLFDDTENEKQFNLASVISGGFIEYNVDGFKEQVEKYKNILTKHQSIPNSLGYEQGCFVCLYRQ